MSPFSTKASSFVAKITKSKLDIYAPIEIGSPLYIPSPDLEAILNKGLKGFDIDGYPVKTRSKVVKSEVCRVLGYPTPKSFKRTKPRFSGQGFDTYVQTANNLQVWNEALIPTRRYVLIGGSKGRINKVRVVTGDILGALDKTGKLTQKYQARLVLGANAAELISKRDEPSVAGLLAKVLPRTFEQSPSSYPEAGQILPILSVYERLKGLIGTSFPDPGIDQERNRGAHLHRLVCKALGYESYADDGLFPDLKHQLLEVKLQTATTIDLGLVTPDSTFTLDIPQVHEIQIRHCDVRYAVFYASTDGKTVTLQQLYLTTGADFFGRFPQFGGKVLNRKLQIHLPNDFFSDTKSLADFVL